MKNSVLIILIIFFMIFLSSIYCIKAYPYQCSISDLSEDTLNIYTGESVSNCPGYVDIISVNVVENENYLIVKISVRENMPEITEKKVFYYFLLDCDGDSGNNSKDPPFNLCDTFYTVTHIFSVHKSVWKSWGWEDVSTNAEAFLDSPKTISLKIPKGELGLKSGLKELPWRVITELEYTCGDFAPNNGTARLKRYTARKNVIITVPVELDFIYIDGVEYKPSDGKITVTIPPGEHEFRVPPEINVSKYIKLIFVEWGDGVKNNRRKIQVTEEGINITCIYEKYLYVRVYSPIGNYTPPEGWYPENKNLVLGVYQKQINVTKNTRYVFSFWNGSYGSNNFDIHKNFQTIVLKDPINVTAVWTKYYFVDIDSRYNMPSGEGWYIENSTASISIKSMLIFDNGTKVVFKKWSGDLFIVKDNFTLTVDKPYHIVAEWDRYFKVSFNFWTPDREPVTPELMSITGMKGAIQLTTYKDVWLKEGIYKLTDVSYKSVNVKPSGEVTFNIDRPKTFDIKCKIYDLSVKVFDIFGFPIPGISVSTVLPNGEVIKGSGNGIVWLENLPHGTYTVRINILFFYTRTMSVELYSDREIVLTIPISALLIGLFLGIIGGGYYYNRRRCVKERIAFKFFGDELLKELSNIPELSQRLEELDKKYKEIFLKYLDASSRERVLREKLSKAEKYKEESTSFYENAARKAREEGRYMSAYYSEKALQYFIKYYDKIISKLNSKFKNVAEELSKIEGEMKSINSQRKMIIDELIMRVDRARDLLKKIYNINPICIDCGSIQKLYNDVDEILMLIRKEIIRLEGKIKASEGELNRLRNRIKEIDREIRTVKDEIEKSKRVVRNVFGDMIGGEASDFIEICGVRINLTGRIDEFFDRYDMFRRELGKAIRSYWKNRRLLGKLYSERTAAENMVEAFQKYLDDLKSDLNRLKSSATSVEEMLDSLDKKYKRCMLKLNNCRERVKGLLEEEKNRLKKYVDELNRLRNNEIYKFKESSSRLRSRVEGYENAFIRLRNDIMKFKSDPGCSKRFLNLGNVRKLLNGLDPILDEINDLVKKEIPEYERKIKDISREIEDINERVGKAIAGLSNLLGKIDEYIRMLNEVKSSAECYNIWQQYLAERKKLEDEIDSIKCKIKSISEEMSKLQGDIDSLEDTLKRLRKMFDGIKGGIKKVIADFRLKEILKDEDIKRLAKNKDIRKILEDMLDEIADTYGKVKIIKMSAESDIDIEKEIAKQLIEGIKDIIGEVTKLPIPDTPEELANEVKDTIRLFGKVEREGDYLRKLSTILSKLPSNPLTPFIKMYSRIIKAFASALDNLADMIWKLAVEEMEILNNLTAGYEGWLPDEDLLNKDMNEIYRKLKEKVEENIERLKLSESYKRRVEELVRGIIIKRLVKILQDP